MLPKDEIASHALTDLIAHRQNVLNRDGAWDEDRCDVALIELEAIQNEILKRDFAVPASQMCGLGLLLDNSDTPNFSDDFKNRLFAILRRAAR